MRSESRSGRRFAQARSRYRARSRDRRGRGLRGHLAPPEVPLYRTPAEVFDDLVMDAVEELEEHWASELAGVEFAVEEVPPLESNSTFEPDTVADRGVALGRLHRSGLADIAAPTIVLYRRPIEARTIDIEDRADLVFMVIADLAAEYLGRDIDEIDPPR